MDAIAAVLINYAHLCLPSPGILRAPGRLWGWVESIVEVALAGTSCRTLDCIRKHFPWHFTSRPFEQHTPPASARIENKSISLGMVLLRKAPRPPPPPLPDRFIALTSRANWIVSDHRDHLTSGWLFSSPLRWSPPHSWQVAKRATQWALEQLFPFRPRQLSFLYNGHYPGLA